MIGRKREGGKLGGKEVGRKGGGNLVAGSLEETQGRGEAWLPVTRRKHVGRGRGEAR